jgi:hypothetical protein
VGPIQREKDREKKNRNVVATVKWKVVLGHMRLDSLCTVLIWNCPCKCQFLKGQLFDPQLPKEREIYMLWVNSLTGKFLKKSLLYG